jgi:hypothetical protein
MAKVILPILILLILIGCKKENLILQESTNQFSTEEAKHWYTSKFNPSPNVLNKKIKLFEVGKIDWNNTIYTEDEKFESIEIPTQMLSKVYPVLKSDSDSKVKSKFLILKNKITGEINAFSMNIISKENFDINNWHFASIPDDFNGCVMFVNLSTGELLYGNTIKNGKIIEVISQSKNEQTNCSQVVTVWFVQICYFTNNDVLISCDAPIYIGSTTSTVCANGYGGGGGNGAGTNNTNTIIGSTTSKYVSFDIASRNTYTEMWLMKAHAELKGVRFNNTNSNYFTSIENLQTTCLSTVGTTGGPMGGPGGMPNFITTCIYSEITLTSGLNGNNQAYATTLSKLVYPNDGNRTEYFSGAKTWIAKFDL